MQFCFSKSAPFRILSPHSKLWYHICSQAVKQWWAQGCSKMICRNNCHFFYLSFAERVLAKKPKIDANEFEILDWVPCTSNVAERLFSQVRHIFADYRKSMLPRNIESQFFLAVNRDFWNAQIVAKLM